MKLILLTPNADPTVDLGQELAAYVLPAGAGHRDRSRGNRSGPLRRETDGNVLAAALEIVRKAT